MNQISGASVFIMSGDVSLVYWSRKTSHSYSHCHNNDDAISEDEGLEVSLGDIIHGHKSLETSQSSSSKCRGLVHMSFETRKSSYRNHRRYQSSAFGIGGYR